MTRAKHLRPRTGVELSAHADYLEKQVRYLERRVAELLEELRAAELLEARRRAAGGRR
jgi:hypothetical protein